MATRIDDFFQPTSLNGKLGRLCLIAALAGLAGIVSLHFQYTDPKISLLWLPTGIAICTFLRFDKIALPFLFLAGVLTERYAGFPWLISIAISAGSVTGCYLSYRLLRWQQFSASFNRRHDVVAFSLAVIAGMCIPATVGASALYLGHFSQDWSGVWLTWWAGDCVGAILVAPMLMSLPFLTQQTQRISKREASLYIVFFLLAHWLIFLSPYSQLHLSFVMVGVMAWVALRFGLAFATISVMLSAICAGSATLWHLGPFTGNSQSQLLIMWAYISTMSVLSLLVTALQAESTAAAQATAAAYQRMNKIASRLPGVIMQYRISPQRVASIPYASPAILQIFEVSAEQVRDDASPILARIDARDAEEGIVSLRLAKRNLSTWQSEFRFNRRDGSVRWLYIDGLPEWEADGSLLWHCFVTDITERKQAERDLQIAACTFESQEAMFVTDEDWRILRTNQAFTHISGYQASDLLGHHPPLYFGKQQGSEFYRAILRSLRENKFWHGEIWGERSNHEVFPFMITLTAITDKRGEISNFVGSFTDISRHKHYEEEIRNLAYYDALTQLPNRRLLIDRLEHLLKQSDKHHHAILFIDLDNFKTLNDTRGHDAGDLLLIETAHRLNDCIRSSDIVARLGGDEFVVVLEDLDENAQHAHKMADVVSQKIRLALEQVYKITDFEHHGSSSIGVSLFRAQEVTVKDLFKRADTAMYEAKMAGRNAVRFFDPAMQAILVVRMLMESNLRLALPNQQFQLFYQVQVNAAGKLIGAEALLRWHHPDRGYISPAEFIPLAEETGLIVPIGSWVLETACAQIKRWENDTLARELTLAVNVSARQFQQADFVEQVVEIVKRHQIDPTRLKIELTESTVLDNVEATTEKMRQLKQHGIVFSMDDFGTGYSSLAYLQRLPLNQLKIDQSFVRDISDDENDATIVRTIISLGTNLGLNVIAEGVETDAQRNFLIEHNCYAFQGYYFSKPLPLSGFTALLEQHQQNSAEKHASKINESGPAPTPPAEQRTD